MQLRYGSNDLLVGQDVYGFLLRSGGQRCERTDGKRAAPPLAYFFRVHVVQATGP